MREKYRLQQKQSYKAQRTKTAITRRKTNNKNVEERLEKQLDFILEVDKLKTIIRRSYIIDGSRNENDTEHSWHLALMAFVLIEHANNKELDILKIMKMVIVHDIVEIDAGDTYAYDTKGHEDKLDREIKAADRIFNILPYDQAKELRALWDEFEEKETPEAKFAATLDRIQPILLNYYSGGKAWMEHNISQSMVIERNKHTEEGSRAIWNKIKEIIEEATDKKYLKK